MAIIPSLQNRADPSPRTRLKPLPPRGALGLGSWRWQVACPSRRFASSSVPPCGLGSPGGTWSSAPWSNVW